MKWFVDSTAPEAQRAMTSGPFDTEEAVLAYREYVLSEGHTDVGVPFSAEDNYLRTRPCVVALVAQGEEGRDVAIYSDGTTRPVGE